MKFLITALEISDRIFYTEKCKYFFPYLKYSGIVITLTHFISSYSEKVLIQFTSYDFTKNYNMTTTIANKIVF